MIEFKKGDLFNEYDKVEAIVNTVNCVGVMGKGVAKEFSKRFPKLLFEYKKKCASKELIIGKNYIYSIPDHNETKFIVNFPTKDHWRSDSKIEYIEKGLDDLVNVIESYKIKSIVMPALGCGNGNLDWSIVKPLIVNKLTHLNDLKVIIYEPSLKERKIKQDSNDNQKPKLSKDRKKLLLLMYDYNTTKNNENITYKEVNYLSYLLQYNNPKISFELKEFGPYSVSINSIIKSLANYYIKPLEKLSINGSTPIEVLTTELPQKKEILNDAHYKKVKNLIKGFEEKNKLLILATTLWMCKNHQIFGEDLTDKVLKWLKENSHIVDENIIRNAAFRVEIYSVESETLLLDL